ncbi:hypothetical protein [Nocardia cyriacigeorgica]|nr:hypothetical protein [Nocardia cyriacigeorgica]
MGTYIILSAETSLYEKGLELLVEWTAGGSEARQLIRNSPPSTALPPV